MKWIAGLALLLAAQAQAADPLPEAEAAALLQRISDAARNLPYEGVFTMHLGAMERSLRVVNRPAGTFKESRLQAMDGQRREVRCNQEETLSITPEGSAVRLERRIGNRHFPDLLPRNTSALASWYSVRTGGSSKVAGLNCQDVELRPRDGYRWGYVLCAERNSHLPLRAVVINESGRPLLQYAFREVRIGASGPMENMPQSVQSLAQPPQSNSGSAVLIGQLPPGFATVAAVRRKLDDKSQEVEHWVFSDGLTHISMFVERADKPVESIRGESPQGMIQMLKRQVGGWQVTILGEAPWPAVEVISMHLSERR